MKTALLFCLLATSAPVCLAQQPASQLTAQATAAAASSAKLVAGSKIYIEPMDGFENYLSAALLAKKVPLVVVDKEASADFILTGTSKVVAAGWAKTLFVTPLPHATASITIKTVNGGATVFAYSVDKTGARKADQSTAEACAKHLKSFIEKGA